MSRDPVSDLLSLSGPERFRCLMEGAGEYGLFLLDIEGRVAAWGRGAERLLGYRPDDILGEPFCRLFFRPEEVQRGEPAHELKVAGEQGWTAQRRWYVRQDGTAFWGRGLTLAL